jgi:hypothetical protein
MECIVSRVEIAQRGVSTCQCVLSAPLSQHIKIILVMHSGHIGISHVASSAYRPEDNKGH